ncbi:hypothetical protein BTR23_19800 [Alkalihalophilus pseudofirmus]|uniref:hypothetical protein n=1 Tax=Alkalihalobacterium alkalinitrilicum TaxID=427920 RepID=UPI00094D54F0|nr:hypothetical protein [Alkalihalobacterium alkalinitrilicum]OLO27565.1 hypothetical protein BTR23_19800 [Alkalihalophilus pseudofirmus]
MKKKNYAQDNPTLTNTPQKEEYTIRSDMSSYAPNNTNAYYAGDSVNKHKEQEEANEGIAGEEIKQQNENL